MSIETKRKFDRRDFAYIAEYVSDEFHRRQRRRRERELQWDEIDRQIAMEPHVSYKSDGNGKPIPHKAWMSEIEPPWQAQTLEVLVADARRMMFPDSGPWFSAHALTTDEYLDRIEQDLPSLIAGAENDPPSRIVQDNADKLVGGWLNHIHRQYEFTDNWNKINGEAFKYGVGVGRVRMVTKEMFVNTARGVVRKNQRIPVLFPRSIKDTYLDDTSHTTMNEGQIVGPAEIFSWTQKVADIQLAANKGSNDPNNENGGWMPKNIKGLEGNDKGEVRVLEYEGDMVVPRTTVRSMFIPGVLVTVVQGNKDGSSKAAVVRLRFRKHPFSSYLRVPYHHEDAYSPYAAGPLLKGRPIQIAGAQALNRFLDAAALNTEPPIGWDPTDTMFATQGGPLVYPGVSWGTISELNIHQIGDPGVMLQALLAIKQTYDDETGVNQPRLGAQTVSHTTAFAKEAELSRGTVRTVDYVRDTLKGPAETLLYMEYEMSRSEMSGSHTLYIDAYRGFVEIEKGHLPEMAVFEAHGSGGPQEAQQKTQQKMAALQTAIQIEAFQVQLGIPPDLDLQEIKRQILTEGGWADVDPFLKPASSPDAQGATAEPGVAGASENTAGPATAAIQALQNTG